MNRLLKSRCVGAVLVLALFVSNGMAEEDPAVTRAREVARAQYEREKAQREAAAQYERQKAIALTRQGVVSIYNLGGSGLGYVPYIYRWKMWDGTYTVWAEGTIGDKKALFFHKLGGLKMEIKFSSSGGGEKDYALESSQLPNDIAPAFNDGRPHQFKWVALNKLDLLTGKPAVWPVN